MMMTNRIYRINEENRFAQLWNSTKQFYGINKSIAEVKNWISDINSDPWFKANKDVKEALVNALNAYIRGTLQGQKVPIFQSIQNRGLPKEMQSQLYHDVKYIVNFLQNKSAIPVGGGEAKIIWAMMVIDGDSTIKTQIHSAWNGEDCTNFLNSILAYGIPAGKEADVQSKLNYVKYYVSKRWPSIRWN